MMATSSLPRPSPLRQPDPSCAGRHRTRRLIGALIATFLLTRIFGPGTAATFYGQPILLDFGIGCLIAKALPLPLAQVARAARRVPLWPALPAATLVFAVAAQDLYRTPVRAPVLQALGDSSYSAYLLHPFLVPAIGVMVVKLFGTTYLAVAIMLAACCVATAAVATLSYQLYERPSNRLLRHVLMPRRSA
jgi:peptidoglycan/LPS O-acetylase OafA/YrhL